MPTLKRYIPLVLAGLMSACLDVPEIDTSPPPAQPDAGAVDTLRPSMTRSTPANGSTNVALKAELELEFSEPMNVGTVQVSTSPLAALDPPMWSASNTRLVLQPSANLAQNTAYTLTVSGQDLAGNELTGTRLIAFSTTGPAPDTTAPKSLGFVPDNQTMGVETTASITILFSEPMDKGSVQGAFSITSPVGFNSGVFTWNEAGTELNFKPNIAFGHGVDVAWRISTSAKDQAGNTLKEEVAGTFRTIRTKTVTVDFDPTTSGALGKPYYFRGSYLYNFEIIGDSYGNTTYRLFFGFLLDTLPENTTRIKQATLKWWISGKQGDPFKKFGNLLLEPISIGDKLDYTRDGESVEPAAMADYNATPLSDAIIIPTDIAPPQGRFDVTAFISKDWTERSIRSKRSQLRLRFERDSDYDNTNDMLFSDAETQPKLAELEVTYEHP